MDNSIEEFITDYIQKKYTIPADVDIRSLNYIDTGYVDSMGFVLFVIELEEKFGIVFSEDDLRNSSFKVVGELIKLVEKKMAVCNQDRED